MEESKNKIPVNEADVDRIISQFGKKVPEPERKKIEESLVAQKQQFLKMQQIRQPKQQRTKGRNR
jgi:hypothetical protein